MLEAVAVTSLGVVDTLASAAILDLTRNSYLNEASEMAEAMGLFVGALDGFHQNRKGALRGIHAIAGRKAQAAMIERYNETVGKRSAIRGPAPPNSKRFANGAMLRALSNSANVVATDKGVSFVNTRILDAEAAQWARLNFGAGARGAASPRGRGATIRLFDQAAGSLSLSHIGPRPAFGMPAGFFLGGPGHPDMKRRGQDQFLSLGAAVQNGTQAQRSILIRPKPLTQGIAASHFIDKGVRVLARELGLGWTTLSRQWIVQAARARNTGAAGGGPIAISRASRASIRRAKAVTDTAFADLAKETAEYSTFLKRFSTGF